MNIKKIVVLLLFLVAIIGIISPVNAALNGNVGGYPDAKAINGKVQLYTFVYSDIGKESENSDASKYVSARKVELNKVNKAVVTIKGYKPVTLTKPSKGWAINKKYGYAYMPFKVAGTVKSLAFKSYTLKLYDKSNKLIKDKSKGKGNIHFGE